MTRGCGILVAAAFAATATWPSPSPCRSSSIAWGFLTTTLPSTASSPNAANRRTLHSHRTGRGGSWSAAAKAAAAGERRESICDSSGRALHMIAAAEGEGSEVGLGSRRQVLLSSSPCRPFCNSNCLIGRRTLALAGANYGGGDGGDGGLGRGGLDPESVARAREAAKNDDYDWFMEFIEGGEDAGDDGTGIDPEDSSRGSATGVLNNRGGGISGGVGGRQRSTAQGDRRNDNGRDSSSSSSSSNSSGYDADLVDGSATGGGVAPQRRRPPPTGRGFQPPTNGNRGDERRRGQRPSAAADSAYDYDLDDEYDREPGRGGWDYDPGLSAGIGERRRDVQLDKVRAKTKPASMRLPLEDDRDMEAATRERTEAQGGGAAVAAATAVKFEPVDSEKARLLIEGLGYTEPEVACMDPDMADLAIERSIRRPGSGMPSDWVAVGVPPPPNTRAVATKPTTPLSSSSSSFSSQTYFGEGAAASPGAGAFGGNGAAGGVDGGALDLDAILGDGFDDDYEETGGGGGGNSKRREGTRRLDRSGYPSGDWTGDREQGRRGPKTREEDRRRDSAYSQDGGGRRQGREGRRGDGGYGYGYDDDNDARGSDSYYYEDEGAPQNGGRARGYAGEDGADIRDGGRRGRRTDAGGGGQPAGRRRRRKEEKEPVISAAERYEREVFGGLGGEAAGGDGGDGRGRSDEDDDAKLWTGVGPDGPWPTMEEFTKLLREETEVRLGLVGPWAAEVVSVENRFRLQAYEKWLEVLDKGIGATLEEAGVFDAAFSTDDEDYDDGYDDQRRGRGGPGGSGFSPGTSNNNLYDNYTNYGYRTSGDGGSRRDDGRGGGRGGDGYGYDPQGRQVERGFDYDGRYGGEYDSYRQRPRRPRAPGRQKFDVGSFLRSGAQSIMQPGVGMEEKAAEFERRYPGRTRSNALDFGDEDDANTVDSSVRSNRDEGFEGRRSQRARREVEEGDGEPRGSRRRRREDRGRWSQAGYQDEEDDYEY